MKTKQIKPPQTDRATSEYAVLDDDGNEVARVYRKPTTKVGFKRGYCIGQVPCFGWFARVRGGPELGQGRMNPKWRTKKMALAGVVVVLGEGS